MVITCFCLSIFTLKVSVFLGVQYHLPSKVRLPTMWKNRQVHRVSLERDLRLVSTILMLGSEKERKVPCFWTASKCQVVHSFSYIIYFNFTTTLWENWGLKRLSNFPRIILPEEMEPGFKSGLYDKSMFPLPGHAALP